MLEVDDGNEADGERGDRDKRKIGVKLGVTNGIINFVFGVRIISKSSVKSLIDYQSFLV